MCIRDRNGFRQLTNSKQEVKSVDDIKNLKIRVAGSNLLMECYKRWGDVYKRQRLWIMSV